MHNADVSGCYWSTIDMIKSGMKVVFTLLSLPFLAGVMVVSFCIPKRKNLWVFGAWFGREYSDNTKILYEYVHEYTDIDAVWITKNKHVLRQIISSGREVFHARSLKGILTCMRARFCFYNCGTRDINPYATCGAVKVQLWHGVPLKKIMYDDDIKYPNTLRGRLKSIVHRSVRSISPGRRQSWSWIVSSSPVVSERLSSAFLHDKKRLLETGYPRHDKLLKKSGLENLKDIVLYAPTHRMEGMSSFDSMDYFDGLDLEALEDVLRRHEKRFFIKLHDFHDPNKIMDHFSDRERIVVVPHGYDIYDIMPRSCVLITDYSSVYIDFLVLDRPMIFFPFDMDQYVTGERGLYEPYNECTPGEKHSSWSGIVSALDETLGGKDGWIENRRALSDKYFLHQDADSCKRIVEHMMNN